MERDGQDFGAAAASLIGWWSDAGGDVALDEAPRNWLKPAAKAAPAAVPASAPLMAEEGPPPQLDLFQAWLATSDTLPFAAPSTARVCPAGDPAAGLMIVTDMP